VILFDQEMAEPALGVRNVESPEQVQRLVSQLRERARTPLWVAIDQEGGRVNRLKPDYGFPKTVSHEELGEINDPKITFAHAQQIARTLAQLGINLNLAPVVDLDAAPTNPIIKAKKRSFSNDPEIVARHALEFCRAHAEQGVLTCAKHFPGHGSARGDTHLGLVDVTAYWTEKELIPFQRLIDSGACSMIMSAHVFNARLDPHRPATLSRAVATDLLRRRLGFKGVLISDDLEMKAISSHYGLENAIHYAIEAGVDLLCFGNNMKFDPNICAEAVDIIDRLVGAGKISEARIDESYQRISELKLKQGSPMSPKRPC
jgi:beta-N-acetylhexosaminidase